MIVFLTLLHLRKGALGGGDLILCWIEQPIGWYVKRRDTEKMGADFGPFHCGMNPLPWLERADNNPLA